jgi:outer membrane protein OmpA-like peptidoglycan-associated protein/tetratricopeptide (TPR) repeat protein
MNHWLLLSISILLFSYTHAQQATEVSIRKMMETADEGKLVMEATSLLQENYFYLSEIVTDKLLEINPTSANYNYRKGFILLESHHDWKKALPLLLSTENQTDKNFDMFSPKELSAPIDVFYHIAKCYHLDDQLDKAETYYKKFIENSGKKSILNKYANLGLQQIALCRAAKSTPDKISISVLGKKVNTENNDYGPVISVDGKMLWFTSNRPWPNGETGFYRDTYHNRLPEDIYRSEMVDNAFQEPLLLHFNQDSYNETVTFIALNEDRFLLSKGNTEDCELYELPSAVDSTTTIESVQAKKVNTEFWEKQLTRDLNGDYFIFSSNREGGLGDLDLYEIRKNLNGGWSEPRNLGGTINSEFDEEAPFLSADGRFLYFSSNGAKSFGGHDVFVSALQADGTWGEARNLGFPFNSTTDDFGFSSTIDGKTAYFSSRRNGGQGNLDIYRADLTDQSQTKGALLQVKVIGFKNQVVPSDISLEVVQAEKDPKEISEKRVRDDKYLTPLPHCTKVDLRLKMNQDAPIIHNEAISTTCENQFEIIDKEIILDVRNNRVVIPKKYDYTARVTDKKSGSPLANTIVKVKGTATNNEWLALTSNNLGQVSFILPDTCYIGDVLALQIEIDRDGYLRATEKVNITLTDEEKVSSEFTLMLKEMGRDIAQDMDLKPIYYDYAKATLRKESIKELDKVVKLLNDNPKLHLELRSHTDCIASEKSNVTLSNRRAKAAAAYLQQKVTNPKRVTSIGFGESQPIAPCDCENPTNPCSGEQHQLNRRTEFIIADPNAPIGMDYSKQNEMAFTRGNNVGNENPTVSNNTINGELPIKYCVQIAAFSHEMSPKNPFFKGQQVEVYQQGNLFKYIAGNFINDLEGAKRLKAELIKIGFTDCFVVGFQKGERVFCEKD